MEQRALRETFVRAIWPLALRAARARCAWAGGVPGGGVLVEAPAPLSGSLGDEALLLGLADGAGGPVTVLVRGHADPGAVARLGVPVVESPYGVAGVLDGVRLAARHRGYFVIGADVVCGAYGVPDAVMKLRLAALLAARGLEVRIVAFSFPASVAPSVAEAFRRLPPEVVCAPRDPISARNFRRITGRDLTASADPAFLMAPARDGAAARALRAWRSARADAIDELVGLNVNGRLTASFPIDAIVRAYADLVRRVRETLPRAGIVLIPHDYRGAVADDAVLRRLAEGLAATGEDRVLLLESHSARAIKEAVAELTFAIGGRFHLAVACAGQAVPQAYVGIDAGGPYDQKTAGLFELLGGEAPCVPFARLLHDADGAWPPIATALARRARSAAHLRATRGAVETLARRGIARERPAP